MEKRATLTPSSQAMSFSCLKAWSCTSRIPSREQPKQRQLQPTIMRFLHSRAKTNFRFHFIAFYSKKYTKDATLYKNTWNGYYNILKCVKLYRAIFKYDTHFVFGVKIDIWGLGSFGWYNFWDHKQRSYHI